MVVGGYLMACVTPVFALIDSEGDFPVSVAHCSFFSLGSFVWVPFFLSPSGTANCAAQIRVSMHLVAGSAAV
jgi:hypothetical protein